MSAYSTLTISRDKAKAYLVQVILSAEDETLGRLLDIALQPRLYNANIVAFGGEDDSVL